MTGSNATTVNNIGIIDTCIVLTVDFLLTFSSGVRGIIQSNVGKKKVMKKLFKSSAQRC